jgi:hypothetical protein
MLGYWLTGECRNIAVPRRPALSPLSRKPYVRQSIDKSDLCLSVEWVALAPALPHHRPHREGLGMGYFRFRRSFKIAPGLRVNVGKRSLSTSFSIKGGHYTTGTAGRRFTVGALGTGLSYTTRATLRRQRHGCDRVHRSRGVHRLFSVLKPGMVIDHATLVRLFMGTLGLIAGAWALRILITGRGRDRWGPVTDRQSDPFCAQRREHGSGGPT